MSTSSNPTGKKTWACSQCTFENPAHVNFCRICNGNRPTQKLAPTHLTNSLSKANSITEKTYAKLVDRCTKSGTLFVDDSFPPKETSLYSKPDAPKNHAPPQWLRPSKILIGQEELQRYKSWKVLRTPSCASDILQGVLGNCWFLSALAVVAEREELLENILVTTKPSPVGAYMMKLCKDGFWTTVIIDDQLPCDTYKRLLYSKAKRMQLWVPLIEKAFAKLHGSYQALAAGRVVEGLVTLTGFPCESVALQKSPGKEDINLDRVWEQLLDGHSSGFLMGASCGDLTNKVTSQQYKQVGLQSNHAYSVLTVKDINGTKLVQLRNPWGHSSWSGDWCDTSTKWTPSLRQQLMPNGAPGAGAFWMSYIDFTKYFSGVDVCKVRTSWQDERRHGRFLFCHDIQSLQCIKLTVRNSTAFEFSLFQEGNRSRQESQVDMSIIVCQCESFSGSNVTLDRFVVRSPRQVRSFVNCHKYLRPGTYVVLPLAFSHWNTEKRKTVPDYVISIQSSNAVTLEQTTVRPNIMADALIMMTTERGKPYKAFQGMKLYALDRHFGGLVVVAENRDSKKWYHVKLDCNGSSNVVSTRISMITADAIPPMHRQILTILTHYRGTKGYAIQYSMVQREAPGNDLKEWGSRGSEHFPTIPDYLELLHSPRPIQDESP